MTNTSNQTRTDNTGNQTPRRIDTNAENDYWKNQYQRETYYTAGSTYDDYEPGYRTGYEGYGKYVGRTFDELDDDLRSDYERIKGKSKLGWEKAKEATRAAWRRIELAMPGDADHDGR